MNIKTIDINSLEWFDRLNGNSYFSCIITLNYGMKSEKILKIPFQYGYGDHYIDVSFQELIKKEYINIEQHNNGSYGQLWQYCDKNNIILRYSKKENCLKRELKHV